MRAKDLRRLLSSREVTVRRDEGRSPVRANRRGDGAFVGALLARERGPLAAPSCRTLLKLRTVVPNTKEQKS